jgi:hypothetical protein
MSTHRDYPGIITLATGREIQIVQFEQELVYAGLLEGLPTREMNAKTIEHLLEQCRAGTEVPVFLIAPVQTPIPYDGEYVFGEPARLPSVACVARCQSHVSDPLLISSLTIVWFQAQYAFPIDPDVLAQIGKIPWDSAALIEEK